MNLELVNFEKLRNNAEFFKKFDLVIIELVGKLDCIKKIRIAYYDNDRIYIYFQVTIELDNKKIFIARITDADRVLITCYSPSEKACSKFTTYIVGINCISQHILNNYNS